MKLTRLALVGLLVVPATAQALPENLQQARDAARARAPESKDSTVVISRVTRTKDDGSTETIITYADGHTKIETTPPKFSADSGGAANEGSWDLPVLGPEGPPERVEAAMARMSMRPEPSVCELAKPGRGSGAEAGLEEPPPPPLGDPEASA